MGAEIRLGTMGWSYPDWRGPFYDADVPATRYLDQYARVFSTIEIDSTFYGTPRPSTVVGWAAHVSPGFRFSAKLPRDITHGRRLVGGAEAAVEFASVLSAGMGAKLGAILVQLPPDFGPGEYGVFRKFIEAITGRENSGRFPWVVEFRNIGFRDTDALTFLVEHGVACATSERLDMGGPLRYVRLLGTENAFSRFDERQIERTEELAAWAERLKMARDEADSSTTISVHARNFYEGHAPATLRDLGERLGIAVPEPPGRQQMSLFL